MRHGYSRRPAQLQPFIRGGALAIRRSRSFRPETCAVHPPIFTRWPVSVQSRPDIGYG